MKIEQRSAEIEKTSLEERTLTARAVPYGEATELWPGTWERFEPGALEESPLGVKLRLEHDKTIGVITEFENRDDGAYITAKISDTVDGRDAYTLLKDGALRSVSIGFRADEDTLEIIDTKDKSEIVHHRAKLLEVSLVSFPAYENAAVTNFRNQPPTESRKVNKMPESNEAITEIRSALEEYKRRFDSIDERLAGDTEPASPLTQFRSYGEYVKAVAAGNELARSAYTGATTADLGETLRPAWLNRELEEMNAIQRITNLFQHSFDLPDKGMSLEFPVFGEDSLVVSKQEHEGDDLPFGKVTLSTGTAPVVTYGGGSEVSRIVIDRSSPLYLSTLFKRLAGHYALTIEKATRTLLDASITARTAKKPIQIKKASIAETTVNDWIDAILAAAEYYDDKDFPLTGLVVNSELFAHLAKLDQAPKALKFTETTENTQGTITVKTLSGSLSSIPVVMAPITAPASFYSKSALEIHEAPGAPLRLQDENITNLTNKFAVYGYASHFAPDTSALAPVKIATA